MKKLNKIMLTAALGMLLGHCLSVVNAQTHDLEVGETGSCVPRAGSICSYGNSHMMNYAYVISETGMD